MDDFDFFLKLAKPLVLNLPNARDRTTAALWLKKLRDVSSRESEPESENIHVEFLKLLLFVMQGDQLTGIFEKPPPQGSLHDILQSGQRKAADMIPLVKRRRRSSGESRSIPGGHPRVVTSIGGDMCEYVAVQEIPKFGIHGYYALSTEPLTKWWNPRTSTNSGAQASSPPDLKSTYDSARAEERDSTKNLKTENFETARDETGDSGSIVVDRTEAGPSNKEFSKDTHEKTRHSEKSLRKIFQAQRSEIAGVETRPSWGRSRYIDRLIDESPHLVGDLDLSEADALLHLYRDRKLMKVTKSGRSGAKDSACAISSRRRQVEARLDMPPCASVPVEEDDVQESMDRESRTCLPRKIDSDCMDEVRRGNYDRCCLSENEEYYPTDPIESVGSVSLRGGSDDAGLASRPGCCQDRCDRRDAPQRNQPTRNTLRNAYINNDKSYPGTHEGMDVDREIAEATALANGKMPFDADKAGNFAWVKKERCRFINDHRRMTSRNFGANVDQRDRLEHYNVTPDSRLGMNFMGITLKTAFLLMFSNDFTAKVAIGEPNEIMDGMLTDRLQEAELNLRRQCRRKQFCARRQRPPRHQVSTRNLDTGMRYWIWRTRYDTSCCGCRDRQYGSEISMETPAPNWRDFAYDSEDGEMDKDRTIVEEQFSRRRSPRTMLSSNDSNALREEVRRLVTDPVRRAPPSTGRIKTPRKKTPTRVGQRNIEDESWDPPGHSTTVDH